MFHEMPDAGGGGAGGGAEDGPGDDLDNAFDKAMTTFKDEHKEPPAQGGAPAHELRLAPKPGAADPAKKPPETLFDIEGKKVPLSKILEAMKTEDEIGRMHQSRADKRIEDAQRKLHTEGFGNLQQQVASLGALVKSLQEAASARPAPAGGQPGAGTEQTHGQPSGFQGINLQNFDRTDPGSWNTAFNQLGDSLFKGLGSQVQQHIEKLGTQMQETFMGSHAADAEHALEEAYETYEKLGEGGPEKLIRFMAEHGAKLNKDGKPDYKSLPPYEFARVARASVQNLQQTGERRQKYAGFLASAVKDIPNFPTSKVGDVLGIAEVMRKQGYDLQNPLVWKQAVKGVLAEWMKEHETYNNYIASQRKDGAGIKEKAPTNAPVRRPEGKQPAGGTPQDVDAALDAAVKAAVGG